MCFQGYVDFDLEFQRIGLVSEDSKFCNWIHFFQGYGFQRILGHLVLKGFGLVQTFRY